MAPCKFLRINQQKNKKAARWYYIPKAEYSLDASQELRGTWCGKATQRLGLMGEVTKVAFDVLCKNRKPVSERSLTACNRDGRR